MCFPTFRSSRVSRELVVPQELDLPSSGTGSGVGQQPGDEELRQIRSEKKVRNHPKTYDELKLLIKAIF